MTDYDRIITGVAVNKTAGVVAGGKGEQWTPAIRDTAGFARSEDATLPTRPALKNAFDLTGKRFGRFVVLGLYHDQNRSRKSPSAWVVRCTCGAYETRKAKTLTSGLLTRMMCSRCDYLEEMKRGVVPSPNEREALRANRGKVKA